MAKTAWPTNTNLTDALSGVGVSIPSGYTAADLIAAAIAEFQAAIGYTWLPDGSDQTLYFDPPNSNFLNLKPYSSITSVKTGRTATDAGTALTVNQDYWVFPLNAIADGKPITGITFETMQCGDPASIVVIGKRGFNADIPESVWFAVLNKAVANVMALNISGEGMASEIQQGLVKVKFGDEAATMYGAALKNFALMAETYRYRRVY